MPKLLVKENKRLILNSVIKKELYEIKVSDLQKEIDNFNNDLMSNNGKIFGPNILEYKESTITADGNILLNVNIYQQAYNYKKFEDKYKIEDKIRGAKCIYLRYDGDFKDMDIIEKKIDVYCYENDLISSANIFVIVIEQSEERIIVDYFKDVI